MNDIKKLEKDLQGIALMSRSLTSASKIMDEMVMANQTIKTISWAAESAGLNDDQVQAALNLSGYNGNTLESKIRIMLYDLENIIEQSDLVIDAIKKFKDPGEAEQAGRIANATTSRLEMAVRSGPYCRAVYKEDV